MYVDGRTLLLIYVFLSIICHPRIAATCNAWSVWTGHYFLQGNIFDIKVQARRKDGTKISRSLKPNQKKLGVKLLYVDLKTKEIFIRGSQKKGTHGQFLSQKKTLKKK